MLDRQLSYALHRLAMESQVLLTEAWPGVFDRSMVGTIRAVQEMVERILSGRDVRFYQPGEIPDAEASAVTDAGTATWPAPPAAGPLGDGRHALAVLRPETVADLCQGVRDHVSQRHALYPQGGATALDYGGVPRRPGVAIDTRALCRVIDYPHADMTITAQAGITASALQSILAAKNQRLLIDVPQADRATLGGVFATNTCGPRRLGFGRPRDQIIGVSFVTSEGIEVKGGGRVVKNVAGYDFPKLLTGSMGTLGIITQMTLKVRPLPEASAIAWVPFGTLHAAGATLDALNTSGARPVALELSTPRPPGWSVSR